MADSTIDARLVSSREMTATAVGLRRAFTGMLAIVCLAGAVGLLGGRTGERTAHGNGYSVSVSYPWTGRPGLDTLLQVTVAHPGGFHHPVTLAVTASYFDLFETQGWNPTPSATTRDGRNLILTFTPPSHGDTFEVTYDSYLQPYIAPSRWLGQRADVTLLRGTRAVVVVPFTTWVLP